MLYIQKFSKDCTHEKFPARRSLGAENTFCNRHELDEKNIAGQKKNKQSKQTFHTAIVNLGVLIVSHFSTSLMTKIREHCVQDTLQRYNAYYFNLSGCTTLNNIDNIFFFQCFKDTC